MKNNNIKYKRGFSLVELLVSIFVFLMIMTGIVQIFAQQISAYKYARSMQNDLENAQFAMNYVAKTLRTGTILGSSTNPNLRTDMKSEVDSKSRDIGSGISLYVYDFSQELCMKFTFANGAYGGGSYTDDALWVETAAGVTFDMIEDATNGCRKESIYGDPQRLTTGNVKGTFVVAPTRYTEVSGAKKTDTIGRATIGMTVVPGNAGKMGRGADPKPVNLQSSVSLRDYPSDLSF